MTGYNCFTLIVKSKMQMPILRRKKTQQVEDKTK